MCCCHSEQVFAAPSQIAGGDERLLLFSACCGSEVKAYLVDQRHPGGVLQGEGAL